MACKVRSGEASLRLEATKLSAIQVRVNGQADQAQVWMYYVGTYIHKRRLLWVPC